MDKPVNEEVLSRVSENRRGFLKKLIGMTFATPIVASFSLDGLALAEANNVSSYCANMTHASNMPDLADCIAGEIEDLRDDTVVFLDPLDLPAARKALASKSLSKAIEALNAGILQSASPAKAKLQFQNARGWMMNFLDILADLGLDPSVLASRARRIIADLDVLIASLTP